jgi:hypothetical protein
MRFAERERASGLSPDLGDALTLIEGLIVAAYSFW